MAYVIRKFAFEKGTVYNSIKNRSVSKQKAIIAMAASMLTAVYYMLNRGEPYEELSAEYRDRRDKTCTAARLLRRVRALGHEAQSVPHAV